MENNNTNDYSIENLEAFFSIEDQNNTNSKTIEEIAFESSLKTQLMIVKIY